jgi:hypothetical protein
MHETFPGSTRFTEKLLPSIKDFNLKTFLNKRTPESWEASIMVQQYAVYLEEKICFVRDFRYEYEQESQSEPCRMKGLPQEQLMNELPRVIQMLGTILRIEIKAGTTGYAVLAAFSLLFKDCTKLYRAVNEGVITLLDRFFNLAPKEAKAAIEIYKDFTSTMEACDKFFEHARYLMGHEIGSAGLKSAPTSLVSSFASYLADPEHKPDIQAAFAIERDREKHGAAYPSVNSHDEEFYKNERDDSESGSDDLQISPVREAEKPSEQSNPLIDLLDMGPTPSQPAVPTTAQQSSSTQDDIMSLLSSPPTMQKPTQPCAASTDLWSPTVPLKVQVHIPLEPTRQAAPMPYMGGTGPVQGGMSGLAPGGMMGGVGLQGMVSTQPPNAGLFALPAGAQQPVFGQTSIPPAQTNFDLFNSVPAAQMPAQSGNNIDLLG